MHSYISRAIMRGEVQNMKLSQAILQVRKSLNLSQMAFAKELGVSFTSINRWENGVQQPSALAIKQLRAFCEEKGVEFSYEKIKQGEQP